MKSSIIHHPSSMCRGIRLLMVVWGCSTMPLWAAGSAVSGPAASGLAARPAKSSTSLPVQAIGTDPCAISLPMSRANAAAPSPGQISALTSLMARAKSQTMMSAVDSQQAGTTAQGLWSSRISMPSGDSDAETSLALKRLIRQVHSLTSSGKSVPRPPELTTKRAVAVQPPAPTPVDANSVKPAQMPPVGSMTADASSGLSPKAHKTLDDLRKNPSRVQDPLETAELLFLSGRTTDAVSFYEEALRRTRAGDAVCAADRAWILFQLGNCLRETDVAKAQEAYMKLIAEYPDSPWTEMARAGGRYLTWYQDTRPDRLTGTRKP